MRCRHNVVQLYWRWFGTWVDHRPRFAPAEHDAAVCNSCGAWLSLGESSDTPDALVELRAAEIAADLETPRGADVSYLEHLGMLGDEIAVSRPGCGIVVTRIGSWRAGYLARVISSHDTTTRTSGGERR